ncbi:fungal-specific transcription factor domain-containing protein [Aspergillus transmontanensis]|uniref:Fungal-specific transcription factor domain-containing protein n=1 Tax=Aspergillus transmontanensis TaxID=1034304 RepID=A0A5N6VN15_9EURO|nr:fungal-specific transcription factor domain-containing protein [Aspergillus transmontanensis]
MSSRVSDTVERNNVDAKQDPMSDTIFPVANGQDLQALGYLSDSLSAPKERISNADSHVISQTPHGVTSAEMEDALRLIPPKPYTDILVQHFLNETNYQYYSIYPPTFSHDYSTWWLGKVKGQPLTAEFTCLLLRVCACSALVLFPGERQKLESELGENIQSLSERYHRAARRLSSIIPPGKGGLTQVQQLFLTASWFKTEALFVESWHALSSAIHEAQELGFHRNSAKVSITEFEREMRRRMWCILCAWDWQMSHLLSRPIIINNNNSVELPNLRLESPDSQIELPSPITHMALQCQLGQMILKIPGMMNESLSPMQSVSVQEEVEKWFASLPSAFRLIDPDTRWDNSHKYVVMQRHQLHAVGYMVKLKPLKQCLLQNLDQGAPSVREGPLSSAIDYALKLMDASHRLLGCMLPMNAKFYFAPFLIFDTASLLCSAIIHDHTRCLPQRERIIQALGVSVNMLGLVRITKTGAICHSILTKLIEGLPVSLMERMSMNYIYSENIDGEPYTTLESQHGSVLLRDDGTHPNIAGIRSSVALPVELASFEATNSGIADIADIDLGTFNQIWDLGNLDLDFSDPQLS